MCAVMSNKEIVLSSDDKELSELCIAFDDNWGSSSGRGMQQCYEELYYLKKIIGDRKFHKMFEIGVDDGGTTWVYANLFGAPESTYYACDRHLTANIDGISKKTKEKSNVNVVPLHMDAHNSDLTNFDFVHIDGDHGWDEAKADFDSYWPRINSGGICILHDTCLWPGCIQLRQYVEKYYDCITIKGHSILSGGFGNVPTEPGEQKGTGITIVFKN